jgi:hypothetical protein
MTVGTIGSAPPYIPGWWVDPPPPPNPAPGLYPDPPLIQGQPDGSCVVYPMSYQAWGQGFNVPGGWDDATQINNALLQYPLVRCAAAVFTLQTGLVIPDSTALTGIPFRSKLQFANNVGLLAIMITNAANAQYCSVDNLLLDGNNANQMAGAWQCGVVLQNPAADGRHQGNGGMRVQNFTGDGFVQTGRGSSQFSNWQIFGCSGFGANIHEDCYYTGWDIGACGIDGMLIQGASNQLAAVKTFFSGAALVSGRGAGVTLNTVPAPGNAWDGGNITGGLNFSLVNGWGNGFNYANISGTAIGNAGSGGTMAACYAQDNARAGVANLFGTQRLVIDCVADSNNNCGTNGGVPNGAYPGFDWAASNCVVRGSSFDRAANVNHMAGALQLTAGAVGNQFHLEFTGTLNDGSNMPPLTAASNPVRCDFQFKAQGRSFFAPVFAATYTPDPFGAEVHEITLTGNITFANPALAGTNTTGYNAPAFTVPGMRLTLIAIQDGAGGHTVTFGAAYKGASAPSVVAGVTNVWSFVYDGTNWLEMSFQNY